MNMIFFLVYVSVSVISQAIGAENHVHIDRHEHFTSRAKLWHHYITSHCVQQGAWYTKSWYDNMTLQFEGNLR